LHCLRSVERLQNEKKKIAQSKETTQNDAQSNTEGKRRLSNCVRAIASRRRMQQNTKKKNKKMTPERKTT
jgi:uncharacterized protein (UPF0335 family)